MAKKESAPVVEAKAAPEPAKAKGREVYNPFAAGEPMAYDAPEFEGVDKPVDCIFKSPSGQEFPAKLLPLPTNKGTLTKVSKVKDVPGLFAAVGQMRNEVERHKAYMQAVEDARAECPALLINGNVWRLMEVDGRLYKTCTKDGNDRACADLMVNVGHRPDAPRWVFKQGVLHAMYAGTPAQGERWISHFKLSK